MADMIHAEETGLLFRRFGDRHMARSLKRLIEDADLRKRLGDGSKAWLQSRSRPEDVLADWERLLQEAAQLSWDSSISSEEFSSSSVNFPAAAPMQATAKIV